MKAKCTGLAEGDGGRFMDAGLWCWARHMGDGVYAATAPLPIRGATVEKDPHARQRMRYIFSPVVSFETARSLSPRPCTEPDVRLERCISTDSSPETLSSHILLVHIGTLPRPARSPWMRREPDRSAQK